MLSSIVGSKFPIWRFSSRVMEHQRGLSLRWLVSQRPRPAGWCPCTAMKSSNIAAPWGTLEAWAALGMWAGLDAMAHQESMQHVEGIV